jgi:hypothetical protein
MIHREMAIAANKKGAGGECTPPATSTGSGSRTITDGFAGDGGFHAERT